MTYDIKYPWKNFHIHLPTVHLWMKSNAPKYIGMSASSELTIHFSEEPSQTTKDRIQMYMDSMTEKGQESEVAWDNKRQEARQMAFESIPTMSWDSMIPAERKIVMQQMLNNEDLDELIKKYLKEERYP